MKKYYLLSLAFIIVGSIKMSAQIPNSGFENWHNVIGTTAPYEDPDGWATSNEIDDFTAAPINVTKSTDFYTGAYAMQLKSSTTNIINAITPSDALSPGFPHTLRTAALNFWSRFTFGGDTALIAVFMTKDSGATAIGAGFIRLTASQINYTLNSIPITYLSSDAPEEAIIFMTMGNLGNPSANTGNSILIVDDFAFGAFMSTSDLSSLSNKLLVFPSQDIGVFNVLYESASNNNKIVLNVFDTNGKLVESVNEQSAPNIYSKRLDLSERASGIYFVQLLCNGVNRTQKIVIPR